MSSALLWRIGLTVALAGAMIVCAAVRPPRKAVPAQELGWLVLSSLVLYAVGGFALFRHHAGVAIFLFTAGVATSALAAWLSRGTDPGWGPQRGDNPEGEHQPPDPGGLPDFDWAQFERAFRAYTRRSRQRVPSR